MPRDPLREWQDRYSRSGTRLGFRPANDDPFFFAVQPLCDPARIVRTRLSAGQVFRDNSVMHDRDDSVSLVIAEVPSFHIAQRGREGVLAPREATLFQNDIPGSAGSREGFAMIEVAMAQAEWIARGVEPGDLLARAIRTGSEGLALISGYIRTLESLGVSAGLDAPDMIRGHVIDLAVLAATRREAVGESEESAIVAARRAAVMRYLDARFGEPDLSVASVANALHLSPRYVQRLLRSGGTSFTAYVTEVRLQHALTLLTAAERQAERISDIAMAAGFSDISYFNRLFRARFGDTPGSMRAQLQRATIEDA